MSHIEGFAGRSLAAVGHIGVVVDRTEEFAGHIETVVGCIGRCFGCSLQSCCCCRNCCSRDQNHSCLVVAAVVVEAFARHRGRASP